LSVAGPAADEPNFARAGRIIRSYAALGDSFTAGRDSIDADRWPDLLAAAMRRVNPALRYENLAVDGATSAEVLDEQVEPALALEARLRHRDLRRQRRVAGDPAGRLGLTRRRIDRIFSRLRAGAPEAALVTATAPESWHFMEMRPRTERRLIAATTELNEVTRVAGRPLRPSLSAGRRERGAERSGYLLDDGCTRRGGRHRFAAEQAAIVLRHHFGIEFEMEGEA